MKRVEGAVDAVEAVDAVDGPRAPEGLVGPAEYVPAFGAGAGAGASASGSEGEGDGDGDSGWDARGKGRGYGSGDGADGRSRVSGNGNGGTVTTEAHSPGPRANPPRRGPADPVKALMHRHRELCERAVDPLEIAVGLEAHGVTDRAAARFRHRDVFALAEEMYARVPRDGDDTPGAASPGKGRTEGRTKGRTDGRREVHEGARPAHRTTPDLAPAVPTGWALFALLPGAACAAAVAGLVLGEGDTRLVAVPVGALAVGVALRIALRYGPLRAVARPAHATRACVCWLLAYALLGDGLLRGVVADGTDGPGDLWDPAVAPLLGLALAVAPATWCARLFAVRAGRRLAASRGLDEFASSVRPLLLGVFALFLAALGALLATADALLGDVGGRPGGHPVHGPPALLGAAALGALLLLARLLGVYGFTRAPTLLLGAAGTCEAAAPALVFAGRLPGCDALAAPVRAAVDAWGPGVVPALACGAAALALLVHAARTLTLASAHFGARDAP
ncbi:hypothetical protein ACFVYR_06355 [Streptomyces sp. NPDC058284]|uniref:hypothetical protein n=1 Tax=unclassified Streptomyces TaxID=2593676 RepID=UPI003661765C